MNKSLEIIENLFSYDFFSRITINNYINKLIEEEQLQNQIKNVNINREQEIGDGSYFPNTKTLNINESNINESFYHFCRLYGIKPYRETKIRFYNLYMLRVIHHEITHAKQTKISEEQESDSLHLLAKEGIELGRRMPDKLTIREKVITLIYYKHILTEKNAESMALYNILQINQSLDFLNKDELNLIRNNLIKNLLIGYKKNKSSAEHYYQLRGKQEEFKKINFTEHYSLIDKLSWGMPIENSIIKEISAQKDTDKLSKMLVLKK